jgi:hypothetical protein
LCSYNQHLQTTTITIDIAPALYTTSQPLQEAQSPFSSAPSIYCLFTQSDSEASTIEPPSSLCLQSTTFAGVIDSNTKQEATHIYKIYESYESSY